MTLLSPFQPYFPTTGPVRCIGNCHKSKAESWGSPPVLGPQRGTCFATEDWPCRMKPLVLQWILSKW